MSVQEQTARRCALCGAKLRKRHGPGRPRKYCESCVPDSSGTAWHRAHREEVNRRRREEYVRRWLRVECLACGVSFVAPREEAEVLVCKPWVGLADET